MNQFKRQLSIINTFNEDTKKLRNDQDEKKKLISCIENLSNELFYEIFDYLDGYNIYQSFSNLNIRFKILLNCSSLRLKMSLLSFLESDFRHRYMDIILASKHQIFSLHLLNSLTIDLFSTLITFNSSFNRLESLSLHSFTAYNSRSFLRSLISLPCLSLLNLILYSHFDLIDFSDVYHLIFRMPVLKDIKLRFDAYKPTSPLIIPMNDQFSTIEYMNIDHLCSLDDLIIILSNTPQIRRLTCKELIKANQRIEEVTILSTNLTHISIKNCRLLFHEFELLMKKISSNLQLLRIIIQSDITCFDADRWEQLILQHMPNLRDFYFQYHDFINMEIDDDEIRRLSNRFTSSFWLERRWISKFEVHTSSWSEKITHSIHPYRCMKYHCLQNYLRVSSE